MKIVKKPNGYYYARFKGGDGRQKEVSTRVKNKARAEAVVRESNLESLELAAQAQVLTADAITRIVAGKKVTLSEALEKWGDRLRDQGRSDKTIHNKIQCVTGWVNAKGLGSRPPAFVNMRHVSSYVNDPSKGTKASSRKTVLSSISTFLEFCCSEGWAVGNPAKGIEVSLDSLSHKQKEPRKVNLFLESEVELIELNSGKPFWAFAARLSYETGLRLGDICQLEWDSVGEEGIVVWTDKRNKRVGPFPMSEKLASLLAKVPAKSKRYIFPEQRNIYISTTRRALLSVQFKNLCAQLGIEGKTFHSLRHTYASRTYKEEKESLIARLQKELAELSVAENLGHSGTKTTKGYIH